MASSLADQSPIMVGGLSLPTPQLFQNIPMLHGVMKAVLEDWLRTVEPYQTLIDAAEDDSARLYDLSSGFAVGLSLDSTPILSYQWGPSQVTLAGVPTESFIRRVFHQFDT